MENHSFVRMLLRPSANQLVILLILVLLSSTVVTKRFATTKVTWEESRGIPLTVVIIGEIRYRPCRLGSPDCIRSIERVFIPNLLLNAFFVHLVLSILGSLSKNPHIRYWLKILNRRLM